MTKLRATLKTLGYNGRMADDAVKAAIDVNYRAFTEGAFRARFIAWLEMNDIWADQRSLIADAATSDFYPGRIGTL